MPNTAAQYDVLQLDAPTVPTALENGVLPIEFHTRPVQVNLQVSVSYTHLTLPTKA